MSAQTIPYPHPWSVSRVTRGQVDDSLRIMCGGEGDKIEIARVHDYMNGKCEAVANLMVAAPDLFEALKDVLRIATAASNGVTGNQPRLLRAIAALKKAQGGAL